LKDFLKLVKVEHFLWGVVLAKLAVDQTFPWGAVPVILFLLCRPLADTYVSRVALKRDVLMKHADAVDKQLQELEKKLVDTQNRLGSLSLAAGLKRQGP
jgi:multisubunit Na+/H+ antiporter MnhG subunit